MAEVWQDGSCIAHVCQEGKVYTAEEQKLIAKHGRLPKKPVVHAHLNGGERKFFDSADHALASKGGKPVPGGVGQVIATTSALRTAPRGKSAMSQEKTTEVLQSQDKPAEPVETQ